MLTIFSDKHYGGSGEKLRSLRKKFPEPPEQVSEVSGRIFRNLRKNLGKLETEDQPFFVVVEFGLLLIAILMKHMGNLLLLRL